MILSRQIVPVSNNCAFASRIALMDCMTKSIDPAWRIPQSVLDLPESTTGNLFNPHINIAAMFPEFHRRVMVELHKAQRERSKMPPGKAFNA